MALIGIIIDIAIIVALVVCGIIGLKKGFLKSIISLFSWVVCLAAAIFTAKYIASWINGIYNFSGLIGNKIASGLKNSNEFYSMAINTFASKEEILASIPANTNKVLAQVIKVVFSHTSVNMQSTDTIASVLGGSMGHICMVVISGILVFVVLMIVINLLSRLFDRIASTKILGGINKLLGLALGLVKAGCIVIAINCALIGLSLVPAINKIITPIIQNNTHIEKVVYNQTDKYVGKYLIEGDILQNWLNNLWDNRKK